MGKRTSKQSCDKESTSSDNKRSYLTMYCLGVLTLLVACVAFYSYAMSNPSPPSGSQSVSHSTCGNKNIWRVKDAGASYVKSLDADQVSHTSATWGSLRPGVYFGMKTKSQPSFLSTGAMWSDSSSLLNRNFRHSVHTDEIDHFEWIRNNGRTFGIEQIRDTKAGLLFNATYLINSDSSGSLRWQQHFHIKRPTRGNTDPSEMSFIHYFGMDCDAPDSQPLCFTLGQDIRDINVSMHSGDDDEASLKPTSVKVTGFSSLAGWFSLTYTATASALPVDVSFYAPKAKQKKAGSGLPITIEKIHKAKDFLRLKNSQQKPRNRSPSNDEGILFNDTHRSLPNIIEKNAVGVFLQFLSSVPLDIYVEYSSNMAWNSQDEIQAVVNSPLQLSSAVETMVNAFDKQFDEKFHMDAEEFTAQHVEVARRGVSNLLGGLGYFHGSPLIGDSLDYVAKSPVSDEETKTTAHSNVLTLFSGTPSRSSFPRGFLWDEGFHQMLMSNWDPYLTMEVLSSWMGCMMRADSVASVDNLSADGECRGGWIPRELILGQEAFKVVPMEFVTQRVDIANPPTLLIVVEKLIERWLGHRDGAHQCDNESGAEHGYCESTSEESAKFNIEMVAFLKDNFFSLHDWVQWFIDSQSAGDNSSRPAVSFRWRGRHEDPSRLAPNTLASGLDDYPRSQFPSSDERHVDLLSWVAASCRIMQKVCDAIESAASTHESDLPENFLSKVKKTKLDFYSNSTVSILVDNLVSIHWSEEDNTFYDVGLVGENERIDVGVTVRCSEDRRGGGIQDVLVEMERLQNSRGREPSLCPTEFPRYMFPLGDGNGGLRMGNMFSSGPRRSVGFIPRVGYVNIFPFILKLLPADSPQLEHMLDLVSSSKGLGSEHGLRSISKKDLFYQKENAPGDAPYWRGPIWMPINYLALGALKHYSLLEGCPHAPRAQKIYKKLRRNLLRTVLTEYDRSGYFWEIYDDSSGRGMRGHPFSGWTTLIVNVMAELY